MKKLILLSGLILFSWIGKAQNCPYGITGTYVITNNLSCDITVLIEITDCCCPSYPGYAFFPGVVIPAYGGTYPLTVNVGCGGDVMVCLEQIDYFDMITGGGCGPGNNISGTSTVGGGVCGLNASTSGSPISGSVPSGISCSFTTWNMSWTPTGVTIY